MANGNPNFVPGFGDISDPENMLDYKLYLATTYCSTLLNNTNCSSDKLSAIIRNVGLLKAQLNALRAGTEVLTPPSASDITTIKNLTTQVEGLTSSDADVATGISLLGQVATATAQLAG